LWAVGRGKKLRLLTKIGKIKKKSASASLGREEGERGKKKREPYQRVNVSLKGRIQAQQNFSKKRDHRLCGEGMGEENEDTPTQIGKKSPERKKVCDGSRKEKKELPSIPPWKEILSPRTVQGERRGNALSFPEEGKGEFTPCEQEGKRGGENGGETYADKYIEEIALRPEFQVGLGKPSRKKRRNRGGESDEGRHAAIPLPKRPPPSNLGEKRDRLT